jgi:hypothetical protein
VFVACSQAYHLATAWLVWALLRRLRFAAIPAAAAAVLFTPNMATFRIYWNPAYIFDLGCGLFCLISLLFWMDRRWVVSFLFFWLAYRSKETAVMLPAVMRLYELFLAERREWRRQIPFLAVSLWFGVQARLSFRGENTEYRAAGSAGALWAALEYYASRVLLIPAAGLAFFAAPFLFKDKRLAFGCASFRALLWPMLMLPRHLNDAYLHVPMLGAAVAMAALFQRADRYVVVAVAIFFLIWLPLDYRTLRAKRAGNLHEATENRAYVSALIEYSKTHPEATEFLFETSPPGMPAWGIESALRYLYPPRDMRLRWIATDRERTSVPRRRRPSTIEWRDRACRGSRFSRRGLDRSQVAVEPA